MFNLSYRNMLARQHRSPVNKILQSAGLRAGILIFFCIAANTSFAQKRLSINGKQIMYEGTSVNLQGMNVLADTNKLSEADVQAMADMGVNFVRLLFDVNVPFDEFDSEGDGDYLNNKQLNDWKTKVNLNRQNRFGQNILDMNILVRNNLKKFVH